MLATGRLEDGGRNTRKESIVGLALRVLVEQPVLRSIRGRRAAAVDVLPGTNICEREVIWGEAYNRSVLFMEAMGVKRRKTAKDKTAIRQG